jgi:hypothetical protein
MDINGILARQLDLDEDTVTKVVEGYLQLSAVHLVLVGPMNTVFGRLAFAEGAVQVQSQNKELLELVNSRPSHGEIVAGIGNLVMGAGDAG